MDAKNNIFKKAISLIKAFSSHSINGFKNADEKLIEERSNICMDCDEIDKESETCKVCGCILKYKVMWESNECPKKKW